MKNNNQKKHNKKKSGINPVVAVTTGAVMGAGVAVAGLVALKDEKNRDKVKEVLISAKDQAVSYVEDMQKQSQDKTGEVEKKLADNKKNVKKNLKRE